MNAFSVGISSDLGNLKTVIIINSEEKISCIFYYILCHFMIIAEAILMSTDNIGLYEDLTKIILQLSSNIIKYAPYLFFYN